jgi:hypothetical protein
MSYENYTQADLAKVSKLLQEAEDLAQEACDILPAPLSAKASTLVEAIEEERLCVISYQYSDESSWRE